MSHIDKFTFKNGTKSCCAGVPRVLEVKSILPPYDVVAWLCLECLESVQPYEDKRRVLFVTEDQLESNEIWYDNSVGAWVTVPLEGEAPPSNRPIPDHRVLKEPVFWETDKTEMTPF